MRAVLRVKTSICISPKDSIRAKISLKAHLKIPETIEAEKKLVHRRLAIKIDLCLINTDLDTNQFVQD